MYDDPAAITGPDYDHSIVNLISALAGDRAPAAGLYPPTALLDDYQLHDRPVVLLVVDGLGYNFLSRFQNSHLARAMLGRLTSVFPTTTATAVTALALGVPAQQHSITGWFTWLKALGCVVAPLPFVPRGGGASFTRSGIEASSQLDAEALLPGLGRPAILVNPEYISDSTYSHALFGDIPRQSHRRIEEMFDNIAEALQQPGNPLVWSYWTELDGMAHAFGIGSPEVRHHFLEIDQAFGNFLEQIRGSNALVVVTADHGLIDTAQDRVIHLDRHPELEGMLQLPLCGEPRAAFCYLRAGRERDFDRYVRDNLSDRCRLFCSAEVATAGWFGRGKASPRFQERIGDRLLLPRENWIIKDRLLQEQPFSQVGVHGGLSDDELYVPLIVAET